MKLTGIKHKLSMVYHPKTDGSSEQTNEMVMQCLRYHVEHNQKGSVQALPKVRFDIMNTMNVSTGYLPFVLKTGCSPHLLPLLINDKLLREETEGGGRNKIVEAKQIIQNIKNKVASMWDSMLAAKISQAHHTNKSHDPGPLYVVGEHIMLAMVH
jgi:hypothetical protein